MVPLDILWFWRDKYVPLGLKEFSKSLHNSIYNVKKTKSVASKAREMCTQYVVEFIITPRGDLYCSLCSVLVKYEKRLYDKSHKKSQRDEREQARQVFVKPPSCQFIKKVVSAFLATNIPLYKLNNPSLKSLFKSLGKELPSETAARNIVFAEKKTIYIKQIL